MFAILGTYPFWIFVNWSKLGAKKYWYIFFLIVWFVVVGIFSFLTVSVDNWGHFGGLIVGVFTSTFLVPIE